jgi:ABC-type microcin C transport system permease subunit YejB
MSVSTASRTTGTRSSSPPKWQVALVVLAAGIPAFLLGWVLCVVIIAAYFLRTFKAQVR